MEMIFSDETKRTYKNKLLINHKIQLLSKTAVMRGCGWLKQNFIMGLDTSHDCWHGHYSSFNRFRYSIGNQIGINLDDYIGYNEKGTKELSKIDHDLKCLFNHSDCDGRLTVKECKMIVKGLNSILGNFNDEIKADWGFKENVIQFRDGCLDAISKKQMVKFH